MKTTMKFLMAGLLIIGMILTSCSDDGEDGLDGIQGEQGISGQNGTDGADGTDGNANVQFFTLEIPKTDGSGFGIDFNVLTPEVLSNNIILMFLKHGSRLDPVPGRGRIIIPGTAPDIPFLISSNFAGTGNHNIFVFYTTLDGDPITINAFHYSALNLFIIKPNTSENAKSNNPDFSKMSYKEVIEYFNIK